ncbi:MAG: hypothetical protein HFACDABA_02302 [Anaerolineales bacterium]|nr:hypothetical protein [Anaerolineales bacterium]
MFFSMMEDLQTGHYSLPAYTTYNHAAIPFAYPPIALYMAGMIQSASSLSLISLIQWAPTVINLAILPLFFVFARQLLNTEPKAALATLLFALTPNSYWWQIVGGGITRAPGALFFLLTALSAERAYRKRTIAWITLTAIGGSLTVLSHPEWGLQAAVVIFLFSIFYGCDRRGFLISAVIFVSVSMITAPWWLAVGRTHGWETFYQAAQVSNSRWLFWTIPFGLRFTGETLPVIATLGMFGLFIHFSRKEILLPVWALLCLFADPRGGLPASIIPFSLLAATALSDGIATQLLPEENHADRWIRSLSTGAGRAFWGFGILLLTYNAVQISSTLAAHSLSTAEQDALTWASANTEPDDRFLILTDEANPLLSPMTEWFPALTGRVSILTVQGSEWLTGKSSYSERVVILRQAQSCLFQDTDCLIEIGVEYEYLILKNGARYPLFYRLSESPRFKKVYDADSVQIFKKHP